MLILLLFLGRHSFLNGPWMQVHGGCITGVDVAARPHSVGMFFKFTAFLGASHWPVDTVDMGHFGVSPIWRFLSFSSNGPVIGCSVKRLLGRICVLIVLFLFLCACIRGIEIRNGCQFISSLVRLWPSSLVVWVGSCHVMLDFTCPGYVILDGITVLMSWSLFKATGILSSSVPLCSLWELGYPERSAAELQDGSLKLQYCTTIFTMRFHPMVFTQGWKWWW